MNGRPLTESPVREIDRAALLGGALAAVVALTFGGNGEWAWLATCAGFALRLRRQKLSNAWMT